jgi:hypothetical protein
MYMKKVIGLLVLFFITMPLSTLAVDSDNDGLSDERESDYYFTDPNNPDTDGDGYGDWLEIKNGYSPHIGSGKRFGEFDYDEDGLIDWLEVLLDTSIGKSDTDGDGVNDYDEIIAASSPRDPLNQSKLPQKIVVDRTNQMVHYYVNGVKILNMPVSTGNPQTPTPAGEYAVERKIEVKRYIGPDYNLPNVKWNLQFIPSYYLHTAYWHNDFGKRTRSHGCVNMREEDAKLLYDYVDVGVPVEVIGTTPLGWINDQSRA